MPSILVIDDAKDLCLVLSKFLSKNNFSVNTAETGEEGLKLLRTHHYDLVLCDYKLPDLSGSELLQKIKILSPSVAIIVITGCKQVQTVVEAFRHGANDFLAKPLYPDELLLMIEKTIDKNLQKSDRVASATEPELSKKPTFTSHYSTSDFIIGKSQSSLAIQRDIALLAPSDLSVIINGETGTGKEFVAQSIHQLSKRADQPFIAIDCGALPNELAGSELFGHVKGSFTGAVSDKPGSFEMANGGTIFLDEIGNLSYENQVKLLRVIQERKVKRIGAVKETTIDVRILAATNENLSKAVKEGRLREDLYHRLNEFKIQLLPLRERKEDILFYAAFFLDKANQSLDKNIKGFSLEVQNYLYNYYWHGNLRELNNVIKRSVLLADKDLVHAACLPREIINSNEILNETSIIQDHVGKLKSIAWTAERQGIIDALEKVNRNKSKASEFLNIDRKTLYNKLKLYNIMA